MTLSGRLETADQMQRIGQHPRCTLTRTMKCLKIDTLVLNRAILALKLHTVDLDWETSGDWLEKHPSTQPIEEEQSK